MPQKNPKVDIAGRTLSAERLFLIAGPCVIENERLCLSVAERLLTIEERLSIPIVFKSSFDKANRTSHLSYRGCGLTEGLRILRRVKEELGIPTTTDVHTPEQVQAVAEVVDIIQIPAFLCRQTDLILEAARTGRPLNIKKGQFASVGVMRGAVEKARSVGNDSVLLTERGTTFGYDDLVVDMRNIPALKQTGALVVFDATHSLQAPAALGDRSGGHPQFTEPLTLSAVAAGADGLFIETHPEPAEAPCDAAVMLPLQKLEPLIQKALDVYRVIRSD